MKNVKLFEAFSGRSGGSEGYIYVGFNSQLSGYCVGHLSKEECDLLHDLFHKRGYNKCIPVGNNKYCYVGEGGNFEPASSFNPNDMYNVEETRGLKVYTEDPEVGSMYVEIPPYGKILCTEPDQMGANPQLMSVAEYIRSEAGM